MNNITSIINNINEEKSLQQCNIPVTLSPAKRGDTCPYRGRVLWCQLILLPLWQAPASADINGQILCLPPSLSCTGVAGYPPCLSHFIPDCLPTCLPDNGPLTVTIGFDICLPAWEAEGIEEGRQG